MLGGDIIKFDLLRLKNGIDDEIEINEKVDFDKEELNSAGIIRLENAKATGKITKHMDSYNLYLKIKGVMILPCSLTLKEVKHDFDIEIDDDLLNLLDDTAENNKNIQNSIDILPIIWENILMEIPMKVVSDDLSDFVKEGNGWKVITDDEEKINEEFLKIKDLL